jgi:GH24 family phage-related lysozyme (muramidase)
VGQWKSKHHGNVTKTPVKLSDLFRYYKALPHQMAAIVELEADLLKVAPDALNRGQPWFKTWSQAGKQDDYAPAVALITEFEGCYLEAYVDPLHGWGVPTIGYGTTRYADGRKVQQGDKINIIEAKELLGQEIKRIVDKLAGSVPAWQEMRTEQRCALISFAYNLGPSFYGAAGFETISKRLREKDWNAVPAALELYRNPGTNVEAGLLRRRRAEGALWAKGLTTHDVQQSVYKVKPSDPFGTRLSANFTLGEFALGQPARRFTAQHQVDTAAELVAFLERVRIAFGGKRVTITSGYRPPAINRMVNGASSSEHLFNAPDVGAVDFYIDGADINKVQAWCDKQWPYSVGYGADRGFVHLGIRQGRPRVRWDY